MQTKGLSLDPRAPEPIFKQIFDQIVDRIERGTLRPGVRLPPSRTLADELGTHRNTVVRAYEDLEAAGFVTSTVGRGTFVATRMKLSGATAAPGRAALPWRSLMSNASIAEPIARFQRLSQRVVPGDHINLTRMQPSVDLLPYDLLRRCIDFVLKKHEGKALLYAPPDGLPRLRSLIAAELGERGMDVVGGDVVITAGSQQALDVITRTLVNPGDTILIEDSTYSGAINVFSLAGARIVSVPCDDEGPDLEALHQLARAGAKAFYIVPNCHNPTGRVVSMDRREALVAWSHAHGIPLIEDDYGERLDVDGEPPLPTLRSMDTQVIYVGSYSKKLIPALRIGFLACPAALKAMLTPVKHAMDLGSSAILQHALAEFLERGYLKAHLARVVPEYRKRRDALDGAFSKHLPKGLRWKVPSKGIIFWLPLPSHIDPERVFEEAQRRQLLVSPSSLFVLGGNEQRGVRLTYCAEPVDRLVEGAKKLAEAIAASDTSQSSKSPVRTQRFEGI